IEPETNVPGHLFEHEAGETIADARIIECGVEFAGGDNAAIGQLQPSESFETDNLGCVEANDGLVMGNDAAIAHRLIELTHHGHALDHGGAQAGLEPHIAATM